MASSTIKPFWQTKSLFDMSHDEWESICDGCAKCCLVQLQDEGSSKLVFTDVACALLDDSSCRCTDYQNRSTKVPNCMTMTRDNVVETAEFAPPSCAYRLLLEGQPLPSWHHLVSGDRQTVHLSNNSVRYRVRYQSDIEADDIQNHIVKWPQEK